MRNYLLLTPGPLSTSESVRNAMLQDWCTWDKDYNEGIGYSYSKRFAGYSRSGRRKLYDGIIARQWDVLR